MGADAQGINLSYALRTILPLAMVAGCLTLEVMPLLSSSNEQQEPAGQLLQRVVDHELQDAEQDQPLWKYDRTIKKSGHESVRRVIETRQGDLDRLISMDGKPLSNEQQEKENKRLHSLVTDTEQAKRMQRDREQDAKRAGRLVAALPKATISRYGARRGNVVELDFEPNPNFHSNSRDTEVLRAMSGTVLVDSSQKRIAQIDGQLTKPVKFGGGLLGHLDKGGTFHVKQSEVQPGRWETIRLIVHMRGKALLFRTVNVEEDEVRTNFEQVPNNLTLAQAAEKLNQTSSAGR